MKKSSKILLALATIWPFLYMIVFMGVAVSSIFLRGNEPGFIWAIIIPLHILTMLWIMGLTVFYMVSSGLESQLIPQGREAERVASDRPPPPPDWR